MSLSKLNIDDVGYSRWQIALAVGGLVLTGAGVYYLIVRNSSSKKDESKTTDSTGTSPVTDSIDDTPKTPLELAQAKKIKGNKYFKASKFKEAIKCYDEAIEICPKENSADLSTFYQNRAAAFEQLKNYEIVLRDCTAALELNSKYVKALQRRAKACEELCDLEQALEDLTVVCIIESFQNQGTLVNVDRVLKDLGLQHAKAAMENREAIIPSKHFIQTYFEAFAEDPIFNSLYKEKEGDVDESEDAVGKNTNGYVKAKQHLQEKQYDSIIECCSNELLNRLSVHQAEALLLKATMHQLRGEAKLAMTDLNRLVIFDDTPLKIKVNAMIKRGTLHMQQEEIEACLSDFKNASLLDPLNSDVFHHRGQIHLLIGKIDEAMADFKKAVNLNKNFPIAIVQKCYTDYRYAFQLGDKSRVDEVMKEFEKAIKSFPKCVECYVLFAQVLSNQREYERADVMYVKAEEVDPGNPTTLVHRAMLTLQWKGDLNLARSYIREALQKDDKCELAYENLATIEVQTGNLRMGVELFDKAIPLAKTEMEMAHLFSLRDAAAAQLKVVDRLGIKIPNIGSM